MKRKVTQVIAIILVAVMILAMVSSMVMPFI